MWKTSALVLLVQHVQLLCYLWCCIPASRSSPAPGPPAWNPQLRLADPTARRETTLPLVTTAPFLSECGGGGGWRGGTVCNHWEKKKRWICKKKNSAQLGKSGQSFLRLPLTAIIQAQLLPKPQLFQRKPWAAGTQLPTLDTPASPQFHCGVLTWPFHPRYGSAAKRGHPLWYLTPFHLGTASPLRNSARGWFPRWAPCPLIAVNTKPHGISPRFGKCHVWERRA